MDAESLNVYYRGHLVGLVSKNPSNLLEFKYTDEWKMVGERFPLSQSMPLDGNYSITDSHRYLTNLLPEGQSRQEFCRAAKIDLEDDFQLLKRLGRDCAGAFTICEGQEPPEYKDSLEVIWEKLRGFNRSNSSLNTLLGEGHLRFSLAGAQTKIAVQIGEYGVLIPLQGEPSTHIVKFDTKDYKGVSFNEAYTTYIANKLGLQTVRIRPFEEYSLIERYDRAYDTSLQRIVRIHQEDICQALGYSSVEKYEDKGGPGLGKIGEFIRRKCSNPAKDVEALVNWAIANVLLGNADGHAKNISLLYRGKSLSIAPFYDILCTRIYQGINTENAFQIGGSYSVDHLSRKHWESMAKDLAVKPTYVTSKVESMARAVLEHQGTWVKEFKNQVSGAGVIDQVVRQIHINSRRVLTMINQRPDAEAGMSF